MNQDGGLKVMSYHRKSVNSLLKHSLSEKQYRTFIGKLDSQSGRNDFILRAKRLRANRTSGETTVIRSKFHSICLTRTTLLCVEERDILWQRYADANQYCGYAASNADESEESKPSKQPCNPPKSWSHIFGRF